MQSWLDTPAGRLGGGAPDRPLASLLEGLGPTTPPSLTEPVPLEAVNPV